MSSRTIVVGVVPDQPDVVVATAARWAANTGAQLVCAWVDAARYTVDEREDGTVVAFPVDPDQADETVETVTPELRRAVAAAVGDHGVSWSIRALAGAPAQELAHLADELDAVMIVVGTREPGLMGSVRQFFNGSVAVQLAHRQPRPVLVVPLRPVGGGALPWDAPEALRIAAVRGRAVLDSRGFPTVEAALTLGDGARVSASSPAGASTGRHEAVELRDGGPAYSGRGVDAAVRGVDTEIAELLTARGWASLGDVDAALAALDGTAGYTRLGANAVVAASIATARAFAHEAGTPLHAWIAAQTGAAQRLPVPHFNVINGGAHAANALDFQEFMIAPVGAGSVQHAVRIGAEVYHALAELVRHRYGTAGLGDEGGFAPQLEDPRAALDLLVEAIEAAGYVPGVDEVAIALDPAANGFSLGAGRYRVNGIELGRAELVDYYLDLVAAYPIRSIEDGFAEDDAEGWGAMMEAADGRVQLVGDDLYVTDPARIRDGARLRLSDAVLIKPNQIGTVSQTLDAVATARGLGMACMVSHRSGETADAFIADLAVGTGVGQLKSGAPARGERVAKYNRLVEIEQDDPSLPYGLA